MALINRISRLFKADFHAVLDQIEEPEALLKQSVRDMEDALSATEQRIKLCMRDQDALSVRKGELESSIAEINVQLEKLEAERLLKRLNAKHVADDKYLDEQQTMLGENQTTLESLRQKAELFAQRVPLSSGGDSEFDDIAWMAREMTVGDDEVEIAYLREKNTRASS